MMMLLASLCLHDCVCADCSILDVEEIVDIPPDVIHAVIALAEEQF